MYFHSKWINLIKPYHKTSGMRSVDFVNCTCQLWSFQVGNENCQNNCFQGFYGYLCPKVDYEMYRSCTRTIEVFNEVSRSHLKTIASLHELTFTGGNNLWFHKLYLEVFPSIFVNLFLFSVKSTRPPKEEWKKWQTVAVIVQLVQIQCITMQWWSLCLA